MRKILLILLAAGLFSCIASQAYGMSVSKVRQNTRFLTDRMVYELNLSNVQYNDIYEINFDFIYNVRNLMADVVRGYDWAIEDYYRYLDIRNEDLRWVLSSAQYRRFLGLEYFYRPIYASGRNWNLRVYLVYSNHNYFYFSKPVHYRTYCGGHYRTHYNNRSYYKGRYHHDVYKGHYSVKREEVYQNNRRADFGVSSRPSINSSRPQTRPSTGYSSGSNREASSRNRQEGSRPSTSQRSNSTSSRTSSDRSSGTRISSTPSGSRNSSSRSATSESRSSSRSNSSSSSRSNSSRR